MANTVYPLKRQIVHVPLLGWHSNKNSQFRINHYDYLRNMHIKNDNYLYYNNTGKWLPFQIKEMTSSDGCHFIDINGKPWCFIPGEENNNQTGAFTEETESILWNITPNWFPYDEYIVNLHHRDCYHNNEDPNHPIRWYFNFLATTKSGKMYKTNVNNIYVVNDPDNPLNWLWPYGDKNSIKIEEWYSNLPENDRVVYKAGFGITCFIITAKGNLYVNGSRNMLSYNSKVNKNFFKVDLENVVDVTYDEWNLKCIYVLTADGVLHYTDSPYPPDFGYISDVTCLPCRVKRICLQGGKNYVILVECEDESYHIIYKNQLLYSFDKEVTEGKTLYHLPFNRFLAIDYNTGDYDCHYIQSLPYDGENDVYTDCPVYLYETTDKMPQMTNIRRPLEEPILPNVDLDIDYYTTEYRSSKYTDLKYLYRFALHQNISNDGLRNVVNYVAN